MANDDSGIGSLQIGHSPVKENDFIIKCEVASDRHIEVPFSHRHLFYAIYWIHEGSGIHFIDFKEYEVKPDRIFFVRPEQIHFLQGDACMKYSALQFTGDFMNTFFINTSKRVAVFRDLSEEEKKRIGILFGQLQRESVSGLLHSTTIIQSELNTLLLELERISLSSQNVSVVPQLLLDYNDLIEHDFISNRQVRSYAIRLGISSNYLNVLTQKYFGKSALEMINERVTLEIKRLLLRTDYDISEIAYKLGFNELSYFSRFFRRNTGMSPHEFRITMNKMYQK
mgnify:FL=1|jgi:AraC-like DNA-binding protein